MKKLRKVLAILLTMSILAVASCISSFAEGTETTASPYDVWDGTSNSTLAGAGEEDSPYIISTPEQLCYVVFEAENTSGKYYRLDKDIYLNDVSDENWQTNSPNKWESKTSADNNTGFQGNFDGAGHIVYGLYTDNSSNVWSKGGLFPFIAPNGSVTIKNVGIKDANINSSWSAGALIGQLTGGDASYTVTVSNCFADESVTLAGAFYTGFIALIDSSCALDINNCYSRVIFSETAYPNNDNKGAFVGGFSNDATRTISNCYVVLRNADYEHGFNIFPTGNINLTCSEVHAANDAYNSLTQRNGIVGFNGLHWPTDFKGQQARRDKLTSFDYENVWVAGKYDADYLELKEFVDFEIGDVNRDRFIDIRDLIRLKVITVTDSTDLNTEYADIDGNSKIDAIDLSALKKQLLEVQ